MAKDSPKTDSVVPLWFQFKPRWYRRLKAIADECGAEMADVINGGIALYLKAHRDKVKRDGGVVDSGTGASSDGPIRLGADLVRRRWDKTTQAERTEIARTLARKRWDQRRNPNEAA